MFIAYVMLVLMHLDSCYSKLMLCWESVCMVYMRQLKYLCEYLDAVFTTNIGVLPALPSCLSCSNLLNPMYACIVRSMYACFLNDVLSLPLSIFPVLSSGTLWHLILF